MVVVVLNYGGTDLDGVDLMPGSTIEASVGEMGCVAIIEAESFAIFGQNGGLAGGFS